MSGNAFRVVFLDADTFGDLSLERFTLRWDSAVYGLSNPSQVAERIEGCQAVVVNKVRLPGPLLRSPAAANLKLIVVAATGTDNVDLETARSRSIAVCNVPGYATQSVAQFAMALILELACHVGSYSSLTRSGGWEESPMYTRLDFSIPELCGKRLGIVGYGRIGKTVAAMGRSFGMEILVSDRPTSSGAVPPGRVAFRELLASADIVTLHCPLVAETQNLIDGRALALMKPAAFLVNTARGGLVDEEALVEALRSGRLGGAALDVLSVEPPPKNHPILLAARELDNLLVTPHCAWSAREARERLLNEVEENIQAFTEGRGINRVD